MDIGITIIIAVFTFSLGIISSAYGARLGRAIDARKEMLEGMRDWIDKTQDFVNLKYQNIRSPNQQIWSDKDKSDLARFSIYSTARWLGISKTLGGDKLMQAVQEFGKAIGRYDALFYTELVKLNKNDPAFNQKFEEFRMLNDLATNQAEYLHGVITEEILRGVPKWLFRK